MPTETTKRRYPTASMEPLSVIEANECLAAPNLATSRFQACFLEIDRLRNALHDIGFMTIDEKACSDAMEMQHIALVALSHFNKPKRTPNGFLDGIPDTSND